MKRLTITILSVLALALTATLLATDQAREQKLQQAIDLIESKGDLASATPLLEDVAKSSDRALAARGLLCLAQAQERFGKGDALATYRRIVRDFGGPAEIAATSAVVAVARTRLAAIGQQGAGLVAQRVADVPGDAISPDGRYTTFVDNNGDLAVHDLASGRDTVLTANRKGSTRCYTVDSAVPSPDSQRIAYACNNLAVNRVELRVIGRDGGRPPVVHSDEAMASGVWPSGWSADGKWILAVLGSADAPRNPRDLVLIPANGGPTRLIKRFENGYASHVSMSPDGDAVAYDRPAAPGNPRRGVFSVAIDGGLEVPMFPQAANDQLLGWFPEGNRILFQSDRGGTRGIWAVRVAGGRAQGEPLLIRSEAGRVSAYGFTRKGDFYYRIAISQDEVYLGALDPVTGKQMGRLARLEGRFTGLKMQATWSPDGDRIAYVQPSITPVLGPVRDQKLAIQTISTGAVDLRTIALQSMQNPAWLPDGRGVIVQGRDLEARQGLHLVTIETGAATPIANRDPANDIRREQPALSRDGRRVFFKWSSAAATSEGGIGARDLASGAEELLTKEAIDRFALSPEGGWLAVTRPVTMTSPNPPVFVIPSTGGAPRPLAAAVSNWTITNVVAWSADSRFVFVVKAGEREEVWQIPTDGTEPRNTGLSWSGTIVRISAHPDGRRLALSTSGTSSETWVLRNLPPQRGK
jgi:Tol biopolymer transport system component